MIKNKPHIIHRFSALLLVLALLLPASISCAHASQGHDHADRCTFAGETHVHETQLDCELGDLQVVKMDFLAFAKAYSLVAPIFPKKKDTQNTRVYTKTLRTPSSRGPPAC